MTLALVAVAMLVWVGVVGALLFATLTLLGTGRLPWLPRARRRAPDAGEARGEPAVRAPSTERR